MRVLIGTGGGIVVGLLCLLQAQGTAHWCPGGLFWILHLPSSILAFALSQGETDLVRFPPYVVVGQWLFLGALVGVILHLRQRSKASAIVNDFNKGQAIPSVPKTRVSIVRVICVIIALLFLLSLLFLGWVLSTPHR